MNNECILFIYIQPKNKILKEITHKKNLIEIQNQLLRMLVLLCYYLLTYNFFLITNFRKYYSTHLHVTFNVLNSIPSDSYNLIGIDVKFLNREHNKLFPL